MDNDPQVDTLIDLFNSLFLKTYNTELIRGDGEPVYLPASHQYPHHRILFAHGYFASALHEVSHWCVAGPERRLLEDFGYWYKPDGRTVQEQAEFERVEITPQAYEWMLTLSAGREFHFSADNLSLNVGPSTHFKNAVRAKVTQLIRDGMPQRLNMLSEALRLEFKQPEITQTQFEQSAAYLA